MDIINNRIPATPRSKYTRYNTGYSLNGGGGTNIDTSNFVKLRGAASQIIDGSLGATGDIVAYQTNPEAGDFKLPIASTDALGCIRIGENLTITEEGILNANAGGGVSSWNDLTDKPSTFPSTWEQLTGKPTTFKAEDHTHLMKDITDLNAVTLDTHQTITGQKTFTKSILGQADVIAYATSDYKESFPIASTGALGCIKVGNNLTIREDGTLDANAGGGITEVDWSIIKNKPSTFTPSLHTHNWNDINNVPKGNFDQYGIFKLVSSGGLGLLNGEGLMLAPASTNEIGGVRIGSGINVTNNGTISVTTSSIGAASSSHTHSLSEWNTQATASGNKTIGNSGNSNYVTIQEDLKVTQNATFSKTPTVNGTTVALTSNLHNHSNLSYLNNVNQNLSTSAAVQHASLKCTGDVVAYSTGSASAPFKYWRPTVSSTGVISWANSTSESVPTSINIKGPKGDTGAQGPQGATGARGATGPQGPTGAQGPAWNGGTVSTLAISGSGVRGLNIYGSGGSGEWASSFLQMASNGSGSATWQMRASGNGDLSFAKSNLNSNSRFFYLSGINAGNAWLKGTLSQASDIRLKNKLLNVTNVIDKIDNIDVFYYTLKDDENKYTKIGVSAQDVKEVFPELSTLSEETGTYSVDYISLATTVAIVGVKELNQIIKNQQIKIEELENRLVQLETKTI